MKTINQKELNKRLDAARLVPSLAHLPSFGLMAPHGWDYYDPKLLAKGQAILKRKGIIGLVYEAAPALFWYRVSKTEIHCHPWTGNRREII